MRLLLLLVIVTTLVVCQPPKKNNDKSRSPSPSPKGRHGRLSDKGKKALENSMRGFHLEKRFSRLHSVGEKYFRRKPQSEERNKKMGDVRKKIRSAKTARLLEKGDDLFEVNDLAGVSEYLFQGDINLTDDQLKDVEAAVDTYDKTRRRRQASTVYPKWTGNTVYYYLDVSINTRKRASIAAALKYLQDHTCVSFVESKTAANRVKVYNGEGCYSLLGMVGGEQTLSIGDGCEVIGTVAHEFTHALGVWHTQMRNDRDDHLYIDLSDVDPSMIHNFVKYSAREMNNYTPYEYGSFMHYSAMSFVKPGGRMSMVPLDENYAFTMGNRQISFFDIKTINEHYGCTTKCVPKSSAVCQNGGVPNPRSCSKCICPAGYSGNTCNVKPSGCGETLTAANSWKTTTFSFGNNTNKVVRDTFTLCNHWITAPAGKKIHVKITNMFNSQCNYGCVFNGIEIKTYSDKTVTNPRYCCPEFYNVELTSNLNPTPIISYNRYYYTTFTLQYRYV